MIDIFSLWADYLEAVVSGGSSVKSRAGGVPVIPVVARRSRLAEAVTAAIAGTAVASGAVAQEVEEVLVTATKRTESVQDVPLAITALSGEFVQEANLDDVKDLVSFTPGVTGNSQDSFIDAISVRGVRTQDFGVGGDPSAAFFKNDLYEGRNGSAVTSLYDIERAEILRGPQGFLFGRNSIGGAFSVHTRKAAIGVQEGYIELDGAERGHAVVEAAVNLPVNDNFAMRIAGYYSTEDGFARNVFNGEDLIEHDKTAGRWSTTWNKDALRIETMLEVESRNQSGSVYRAIDVGDTWETLEAAIGDIDLAGSNQEIDSDQSSGDNDDSDILTLGVRVDYDFDGLTLTSNTGYKDHDYYYNEDYDGTPLTISNYRQDQEGDYLQQEFRLTSNIDGPFSWYAGVSFYKEEIDAKFTFTGTEDIFCSYYGYYYYGTTFSGCEELYAYYGSPFSPSADGRLVETGRIIGDYTGWGAYVDLSWQASEQFDISVGARYSKDEKDFTINVPTPDSDLGAYWAYAFSTDGDISETRDWDDVQLRFVARYQPTDTAMLFGSYTEGFKSGGFGSFALRDPNGDGVAEEDVSQADGYRPNFFAPETVDSWEFGYKDRLGRSDIALTAFFYDYQDLQVVTFDGGAAIVRNVGQVDGRGLEGSITSRLGDNWTFYGAASWLDTEATQLQSICALEDPNGCEGSSLFWAPEFSWAMTLDGQWPAVGGAWTGRLEMFGESERGGGFENLAETRIDSYADVSLRLGYESDNNWNVGLYVENLTDEFTWDGLNNNGGVLPAHFFGPKRPRTVGVTFGYRWE